MTAATIISTLHPRLCVSQLSSWATITSYATEMIDAACNFVIGLHTRSSFVSCINPTRTKSPRAAAYKGALRNPISKACGHAANTAHTVISHAFESLGWKTIASYINLNNGPSIPFAKWLGTRFYAAVPQPKFEHPCRVHPLPKPGVPRW